MPGLAAAPLAADGVPAPPETALRMARPPEIGARLPDEVLRPRVPRPEASHEG